MRIRFAAPAALAVLTGVLVAAPSPHQASAVDYDCSDFANQAEAQEYLLAGDPYPLDADSDGIACEDLPCPCSSSSGEGSGQGTTPMPPPPYRLDKADARRAARKVAREFTRGSLKVTTSAVGRCQRLAERRVDCLAVARGAKNTSRTVCNLRIAVRARNEHPDARLTSSRCRTISTLKLTADRARAALVEKASEVADKSVGIIALERASPTSFRGLAEWTRPGPTGGSEKCTAFLQATLFSPDRIQVSVPFFECEPASAP